MYIYVRWTEKIYIHTINKYKYKSWVSDFRSPSQHSVEGEYSRVDSETSSYYIVLFSQSMAKLCTCDVSGLWKVCEAEVPPPLIKHVHSKAAVRAGRLPRQSRERNSWSPWCQWRTPAYSLPSQKYAEITGHTLDVRKWRNWGWGFASW